MRFGEIYNGDDEPEETPQNVEDDPTGEKHTAILKAVKEALDRLNEMELVDPRPSPSVPTPHPLDEQEKEVNDE